MQKKVKNEDVIITYGNTIQLYGEFWDCLGIPNRKRNRDIENHWESCLESLAIILTKKI